MVSTMAHESSKTSPTEGQDGPNNELNIRLLSSSADSMLTWAGRFIDAAQVLFCLFGDFTYCGLSYAHCPLLPSGMMGHVWTPSWYTQLFQVCLSCIFVYCGLSYAHCLQVPSDMLGRDWTPSWYQP